MKIRTQSEIARLDEDLHLFEETDWRFLEVLETKETNFEYFDDSKDLSFSRGTKFKSNLRLIIALVACLLVFIGVGAFAFQINKKGSIDNSGIVATSKVTYIDGTEMGSDTLIQVSNTISGYFQSLSVGADLGAYCANSSSYAKEYKGYISAMQDNFDTNDCYARAMNLFKNSITYNYTDKVIFKNGTYYAYVYITAPSTQNIEEYCYLLQYNVSKHFSSNEVTETDLQKYLINNINLSELNRTTTLWCFELNQDYKIISDKGVSELCITSYKLLLDKMINYLGSVLVR